jgi:hypothetical protein
MALGPLQGSSIGHLSPHRALNAYGWDLMAKCGEGRPPPSTVKRKTGGASERKTGGAVERKVGDVVERKMGGAAERKLVALQSENWWHCGAKN